VLPDLPAIAEAGVPGYEATAWYGLFAAAGTPRDIVVKLNDAIVKIIHQPDVVQRMADLGAEPVGSMPDEYAAFIKAEMARWSKVVKQAGIRAE